MDYTALSLSQIRTGLNDVAREVRAGFGSLSATQLNWRPDEARWSVAQCFDHLLTANRMMLTSADAALDDSRSRSIWQRLPVWPELMGPIMVRSQAPASTRKYKAPAAARPSSSAIAANIITRFADQHREIDSRLQVLDPAAAARTVMASPFARIVTYSVLDGWRLLLAHEHRHFEQARRVTESAQFPSA